MHCPDCGTQIVNHQKYCRSCGMDLEGLNALLAARRSGSAPAELGRTDQEITRRAIKLLALALFAMLIGTVVGVCGKKFFHDDIVSGVGAVIAIAGMFLIVFALFQAIWSKTTPGPKISPDTAAVTNPELRIPLAAILPASIPSITESTTRRMGDNATNTADRLPVASEKRHS
jgi:hypothetical protein